MLLLETDVTSGLKSEEAEDRLRRFGPNVLPEARRGGLFLRLVRQFHHPLIYVLLAAVAVTLAMGEVVDAGVILGVVLRPPREPTQPILTGTLLFRTALVSACSWAGPDRCSNGSRPTAPPRRRPGPRRSMCSSSSRPSTCSTADR